jgi:DNA processing protein
MAVQDTVSPLSSRQDFDRLADWLRLARTPGISRLTANLLLAEYGSPQAVLLAARQRLASLAGGASPSIAFTAPAGFSAANVRSGDAQGEDCAQAGGARKKLGRVVVRDGDRAQMTIAAARLLDVPLAADVRKEVDAALEWASAEGNTVITQAGPEYPPLLRHIPDPPLLLYVKGNIELLQKDALAIVGSRNATLHGKRNAEEIAQAVAAEGLTIVSGLALGIDAAAHTGGLQAQGSTIAVIGTGIDRIYPGRNAGLARRIASEGCLISEFALGALARPHNFPIRNRIIAGIARATLVVEASARSGSRITAHQAMNFGREVLVMPGSVHSPFSQGCHALIREGARLAASAQHVLEDLGLRAPESIAFMLTGAANELLEQLSYDPIAADELAARLHLDPAQTQASLLALELAGVVERLPGGAFQRSKA